MITEEQRRQMSRRLRGMGLKGRTAEAWITNFELRDAPLVKSEVVHDPDAARVERVRVGRFVVVKRRAE